MQKQNKDKWAAEDKQIDAKLAELEKKYGKKPNVIYILPDDIGWGETGAYGGGEVRGAPTPRLDEMAGQGIQFTSFYAEPSCAPSRIALMTGRHPVRTGLTSVLFPGAKEGIHQEEVTLAELMSKAGYSTAMFGKWHIGEHKEKILKLSLVSIPVQDPIKAHEIYTSKLGFISKEFDVDAKLAIIVSAEDSAGTAMLLEPCQGNFAESYQKSAFEANLPIMVFGVKDVEAELDKLKAAGIKVRPELNKPEWGLMNMFEDGCGNILMIEETSA